MAHLAQGFKVPFIRIFILVGLLFGMNLSGGVTSVQAQASPSIVRGPYIQWDQQESMVIRWRTSIATDSRVSYSQDPAVQDLIQDDAAVTTEHSVKVQGLSNNTKYYYKVGSTTEVLSARNDFNSPPDDGHPLHSRFWVLGDTGKTPKLLKKIFKNYEDPSKYVYPNLMVFLGDNAYDTGADSEYQTKLFNIADPMLARSISFSALGEHDTAGALNPPPNLPYFDIFDFPTSGETGGVPSGTEKYYSFNYGSVHFVALDSMTSDRSATGNMLTWLEQDLTDNNRPWIVAYWHHSPYSKGNHDSDVDLEMSEMRQNANQVLENHGVDLVLGAHSNTYERSFLIDGHYGTSDTFVSSMLIDGGNGRVSGDGPYQKQAKTNHTGAVYVVVGNSGTKTKERTPLNHPAMFTATKKPGSVVVDLDCANMNVQFINKKGKAVDEFTINKINIRPTTNVTSPAEGATFTAPANITISATASDPDTKVRKVRFLSNGTDIGSDFGSPYSIQWTNVGPGSYTITAIGEDELCGAGTSTPIHITVN